MDLMDLTTKLLFTCIRSDAKARESDIVRLIEEGADLEYLSRLASAKGVSSIAHRALKFYKPRGISEEKALRSLKVSHLEILATNDFYKKGLKFVMERFAAEHIPVIPLKGTILSQRLYGDITSRDRSVDMDLLVKRSDVGRARVLLEKIGYEFKEVDETEARQWCHIFDKPGERMVELHWDITMDSRTPERINGLWEKAEEAEWEGIKHYDMKPAELLLYLSAHIVNSDSFRRLKYVCDIERLLGKYGADIDWTEFHETARRWRLTGSLYASLKLVRDIFGVETPLKLLIGTGLSLPRRALISAIADERVYFRKNLRRRALDTFLSYTLFELVEAVSIKDYARIFKKVFFPPVEEMQGRGYVSRVFGGLTKAVKGC